jgi:multiple sugar transport system substrate-binding protein
MFLVKEGIVMTTTISFWCHLDVPHDPVFYGLVEDFNRTHRDVQVDFREVPWYQEYEMLLSAIAEGNPPDCSTIAEYWIGGFIAKGLLAPLDDFLADWEGAADLDETYLRMARLKPDAPLYNIGGGMVSHVLYYRKDIFEEADIEPPKTHDQFLAAMLALTDPPHRYGSGQRGGRVGHRFWGDWVRQRGMRFFDDQVNPTLNTPEAVEANQWLIDLYRKHRVTPPTAITDSFPQHLVQFRNGEIAMIHHATHLAPLLVEAVGVERVGVMPMLEGPAGRWCTPGWQCRGIYERSKNKEAAWVFLSWLAEAPQVKRWCGNPRRSLIPNVKSLLKDPVYREDPMLRVSVEQKEDWGFDPWWHPAFGEFVEKAWPQNWQRALRGDISSQQMMDNLQAVFEGIGSAA